MILRNFRVTIICRSLLYLLDSLFQYTFIQLMCQLLHNKCPGITPGQTLLVDEWVVETLFSVWETITTAAICELCASCLRPQLRPFCPINSIAVWCWLTCPYTR